MKFLYLLAGCLFFSTAFAADVSIYLQKDKNSQWFVTYKTTVPVSKLSFVRTPDDSRTQRWTALEPDFSLQYIDGVEVIAHKQQKPFSTVSFQLTPTYVSLPKDYAPFSPFSDGGLLLHSGRFFVCPEECTESDNQWEFKLESGPMDTIVAKGEVFKEQASWSDKDSGSNIYIGPASISENEHYISIIDPGLPAEISTELTEFFPQLLNYFAEQFQSEQIKPMLFASYGYQDGGRYGNQGGTLPGQVFMHWYGSNLSELVKDPDYINHIKWFFAHEAAHIYQQGIFDNNHAWIHEGGAELMAYDALFSMNQGSTSFMDKKIKEHKTQCTAREVTLDKASDSGRVDLHYSCGFWINRAIQNQTDREGIYSIWRAFTALGDEANVDAYLDLVKDHADQSLMDGINGLVDSLDNRFLESL